MYESECVVGEGGGVGGKRRRRCRLYLCGLLLTSLCGRPAAEKMGIF